MNLKWFDNSTKIVGMRLFYESIINWKFLFSINAERTTPFLVLCQKRWQVFHDSRPWVKCRLWSVAFEPNKDKFPLHIFQELSSMRKHLFRSNPLRFLFCQRRSIETFDRCMSWSSRRVTDPELRLQLKCNHANRPPVHYSNGSAAALTHSTLAAAHSKLK